MTIKEELDIQIEKCGSYLGGKCRICKSVRSSMLIHHRWYIKNDVIYKNYPQNDSGRLQYYKDLEPLIKRNVKRFSYMCNSDHYSLGKFCQFGDEKFNALCLERKLTHKR
mgnify:CR=1 FL=1